MEIKHRIKPLPAGTKMSVRKRIFRALYPLWSLKASTRLRRKRLALVDGLLQGRLFTAERILEVGCANGQDFVKLFQDKEVEIYGLDLEDYKIQQSNFTFIHGDAESIPYPDNYFDVSISVGVFEHIQPIEKLAQAVAEIVRVSKSYCIVVPSVGTFLEPHVAEFFWQIRDHNRKTKMSSLNYFSDEAWLQFRGLADAKVKSFWYVPFVIKNLAIYNESPLKTA